MEQSKLHYAIIRTAKRRKAAGAQHEDYGWQLTRIYVSHTGDERQHQAFAGTHGECARVLGALAQTPEGNGAYILERDEP